MQPRPRHSSPARQTESERADPGHRGSMPWGWAGCTAGRQNRVDHRHLSVDLRHHRCLEVEEEELDLAAGNCIRSISHAISYAISYTMYFRFQDSRYKCNIAYDIIYDIVGIISYAISYTICVNIV